MSERVARVQDVPVDGATDPGPDTSPDIASAQRQLALCQWIVPASTGGLIVLDAVHGEIRRPNRRLPGILAKLARPLHRSN